MSRQLIDLLSEGLLLWVDGGELCFRARKGRITPALREQLASAKAGLLEELEQGRKYALPSLDQQRLWYLDQLEPGRPIYNITMAYRLRGDLDVAALERSLNQIVARHDSLRTTFGSEDGEPFQIICSSMKLELPRVDLTQMSGPERQGELKSHLDEQAALPFDLGRPPLVRAMILKTAENDHVLAIMTHHIIFDGWSEGVLLRELASFYEHETSGMGNSLAKLDFQYSDFVMWQREFQSAVSEEQLSYWREQLAGELPVLELPTDLPRPAVQTYEGATETRRISKELVEKIRESGRREGATLFMTLLAVFNVLLHRYSGQQDVLVGSPIANRNRLEFEEIIGFLTNTLVIRSRFDSTSSFRELLARVRETCLGAFRHQEAPFGQLVEELQPIRDLSRTPLFQVMFVLAVAQDHISELGNGIEIKPLDLEIQVARTDLVLWTRQDDDGVRLVLEYDTNLFHKETARRMLEHYQNLLEGIAVDPDRPVHALPLFSGSERDQMLLGWNATESVYSAETCFHQLFERQVEESPGSTAVVFKEEQLSYRELNRRSNQLAHYLRGQGVGPNVLVGICVDRSLEMLVALLGIHKAGGAYVPLDPDFPEDRLAFMVRDAGVPLLLTEKRLLDALPEHQAKLVVIDAEWETIAQESVENPVVDVTSEDLAYVIYTSGSTGKPKGVEIPHGALTNFLESMSNEPGLSAEDRLLSVTTLSFDIAALELLLPLLVGASVTVVSREAAADGVRLLETLETSDITVMQATPATWRLLLEVGWQGSEGLKVLCGGEALPRDLAEELLKRSGSLWNMYGPTETTIWSACSKVEPGKGPVLIGRPIANTQVYLLDEHREPVPIGVPGELYIGGAGLARGYLGRAELTAERFVESPLVKGARIYRTGDLARYRSSGEIECLGRLDHQVKVRGFRIELEEIESVLRQHPTVDQAVVTTWGDGKGDQRLFAHIVEDHEHQLRVSDLRRYLREKLPDYMVPSRFIPIESLPLTPNGKVDRSLLSIPSSSRGAEDTYIAPRTDMEKTIARVWQELLSIDRVGVGDNFFDLGGHSLLSLRMISRLETEIRQRITPREVLLETLQQLASSCEKRLLPEIANENSRDSASARDSSGTAKWTSRLRSILSRG